MEISRRRFLEATALAGAGLATGCSASATHQSGAAAEPRVIPAPAVERGGARLARFA